MPDASFQPELFEFLHQLKRHNSREWFTKNKHRYQRVLLDPALQFIRDFGPYLYKLNPHFAADARPTRGSLFRIYRDTRFAADKRPYKTHVGIHFSHADGKDVHAPIFYLHLEPGGCFASAGIWHPDSRALTQIRSAIVEAPKQWAVIARKLEIEGEALSRPPHGFDPAHPFIEDLKRKDFLTSVALTEKQVCSPSFIKELAFMWRKMLPLVAFTARALELEF